MNVRSFANLRRWREFDAMIPKGPFDFCTAERTGPSASTTRRPARAPIHSSHPRGIPENPRRCRRPGAVEAFLALLGEVRAAGSWKRYAAEPRVQLVVLRKLAESGRATATRGVLTRLFAPRRRLQSIGSPLPDVLFWKILEFWRTDRDP